MQLFLDSAGSALSVHEGMFAIKHKNQPELYTIAAKKVTHIFLSRAIRISTDALLLALQHDIDVLLIDYAGKVRGRLWNNKFGSIATLRRKQLAFAESLQAKAWIKAQILQKTQHQIGLAYQLTFLNAPQDKALLTQLKRCEKYRTKIQQLNPEQPNFSALLRGLEASVAKEYFAIIAQNLPTMFQFKQRTRRPAKDYFNCILNYLYGILYAHVEAALLKAGLDPAIGFWHVDEYNQPTLCYDFIEPYRIWADTTTVRLCQSFALQPTDFSPHQDGLWLQTSGKKQATLAFQQYLQQITTHPNNSLQRTRLTHLYLDAHALAQTILQFNNSQT